MIWPSNLNNYNHLQNSYFEQILFFKVFSFERKCYSRDDLGRHRRIGDIDNTSHRGHPICEYCNCRYFDRDELFKHMRREHFFCHFCDADGLNCYYV